MPGVIHLVGTVDVQKVEVSLTPTRSPAGQDSTAAFVLVMVYCPCSSTVVERGRIVDVRS
jgi:hypothetical protein